jgi:hypothetical protein
MFFIEPSIFTQISGSQRMRRSKRLNYELESKRRAVTTQSQQLFSALNLRNATNLLRRAHLQHALGGEIS